jgi:hypothetical protein
MSGTQLAGTSLYTFDSASAPIGAAQGADVVVHEAEDRLGRLTIDATRGDTDGDHDEVYAFGARSLSIRDVTGGDAVLTFDSGDLIEQILASQFPDLLDDVRSYNNGRSPRASPAARWTASSTPSSASSARGP